MTTPSTPQAEAVPGATAAFRALARLIGTINDYPDDGDDAGQVLADALLTGSTHELRDLGPVPVGVAAVVMVRAVLHVAGREAGLPAGVLWERVAARLAETGI